MRRWTALAIAASALLPAVAWGGIKGDLNGDGAVDAGDAMLLVRIAKGDLDPSTLPEGVADVAPIVDGIAGDEVIDLGDALLMLRALSADVDADGLDTPGENAVGTSPFCADTDADGYWDGTDPDPLAPTPPGVPGDLRVLDGAAAVQITWSAPVGIADSYLVHRYGTDGSYAFFALSGSALSFLDTGVMSGVVYRYWVQAVNPSGQGGQVVDCDITDPANMRMWLTGALGPIPNPYFSATVDGDTATFVWEESADATVTGYKLYASTTAVPLGQTGDLALQDTVNGKSTTTHQISGLASGTHYFRITAFSSSEESLLASARQIPVGVN